MLNVKNHHVFSDKFVLNVLDLNHIELATDGDRLCEIDHWAKLFKAKTWEDLRMIAETNKYMNAAAAGMYERNADKIIREQCLVREENLRYERWQHDTIAKLRRELEECHREIAENHRVINEQQGELDALKAAK